MPELVSEKCTIAAGKSISISVASSRIGGECANAIRKAKKIVTYELNLEVAFECSHGDTRASAAVLVEKIDEDIAASDYVVSVTCDADESAKRKCADDFDGMDRMIRRVSMLKKVVEKKAVPLIKEAIAAFIIELNAK